MPATIRDTEKRLAEFFGSVMLPEMPATATNWHVAALETELRKACGLFKDYLVARIADAHASTSDRLGDPDELAGYFDDFVAEHVTGPLRNGTNEAMERQRQRVASRYRTASWHTTGGEELAKEVADGVRRPLPPKEKKQ